MPPPRTCRVLTSRAREQADGRLPRPSAPSRSRLVIGCLEKQLRAELNIASVLHLARDLAEAGRAGDVAPRGSPARVIERVEELAAELQRLRFGEAELLHDRRIEVEEARSAQHADARAAE